MLTRSTRQVVKRLPSGWCCMCRIAALVMVGAAITWTSDRASAGAVAECSDPVVFPGAKVNAVILPYTYTGPVDKRPELSETARKLSLLIQLDTLLSMVKYRSVGASNLVGTPDQCDVDVVARRVLQEGGRHGPIQPKHGVLFLWGRIYEEGTDIYVRTYLRFLRKGVSEGHRLRVSLEDGARAEFVGRLPTQTVAFAPRRLTANDIEAIEKQFRSSVVVRSSPNVSAPGTLMPLRIGEPFSYWVMEVSNGWMRIEPQPGFPGPRGWVLATVDRGDWRLHQSLPELDFVDAVAGYLRYRVAQSQNSAVNPHSILNWVRSALMRYEQRTAETGAPLAKALGRTLVGVLEIFDYGRTELFHEARKLIPYNANMRNLEAVNRVYLCCVLRKPGVKPKDILDDWQKTLALDPRNVDVLSNLKNMRRLKGQVLTIINCYKTNRVRLTTVPQTVTLIPSVDVLRIDQAVDHL